MSYTVKSSEKLRKAGAETETKALLYLMNFRSDSDDIYYFVVDFFNDLTGMNNMATRLWDVQSKGNHNVGPKAIGRELVTLFKNYMSEFTFETYILFVGSVSGALRKDPSLTVFGIENAKDTAVKLIKEGLVEEGNAKAAIVKNQLSMIVDPVLFMQLYFVGQDKKDTSNIAHHGFYNKQDYIEMLYAYAGLGGEQLSQERIDEIKHRISELSDEKKVLLQQHKILKSKKAPVSYLSAESDRLAFGEKVANLERVQSKIAELRKLRNASTIRKSKWEYTINELRSLNRSISCGELRCMDCNSTNISFSTGEISQTSYSFDVSTVEMRTEIINSISEKIAAYAEEIQRLSAEICAEQEKMQSLMEDENVSLESIVAYKKDIFSASDAEGRIKDIENEITSLKSQLVANENSSQETQARRVSLLTAILGKMNELYHQIDPDGNLTYTSLFTQRNEVYSGSEATVFHLVKLFALQQVLRHNCPIIVDSFRAEDLSTGKEKTVLEISKSINNQVILTTTLKHEELGKYDSIEGVNHINYISHIPSKILDGRYVADFLGLLSALSIKVQS